MTLLSRISIPAMALGLVLAIAGNAAADVKLPAVISSHMVLQRDSACPIWGWADPGEDVTVEFAGQSKTAKADDQGRWIVRLEPMKASSESRSLTVRGENSVTLNDVLVGEVWLCSGQSNMEWSVAASANPAEEIAAADHPRIRHIKIEHVPAAKPEKDAVSRQSWTVCSPKTVPGYTAVGYYFARHLVKELDVPVGLIGSNWGGTRIEPWTSPEGFKSVPALKGIADNLDKFPEKQPNGQINHQSALALYNGMIRPLLPYAIRGALWYQGESNNGEGMLYFEKMKALIAGWRKVWDNPELPFYFVQLAPFDYGAPRAQDLPGIWEAQEATLAIPNTGMAVTTDLVDNIKDIHPKNKQDVGKRLALWALAKTYGRSNVVHSGPRFKEMKVEGKKIRLTFDHIGGGLASRDGKDLTAFQIAGEDKAFVDAKAVIDGDDVVVSADSVEKPTAVRFGWHQLAQPNFANKDGLPASPFRTDKDKDAAK